MAIKSHVFGGKRYRIRHVNAKKLGNAWGACDPPTQKDKEIWLYRGMPPKKALEVEIHEVVHAIDWRLDEAAVKQMGKDISSFLWRLGYRKVVDGRHD